MPAVLSTQTAQKLRDLLNASPPERSGVPRGGGHRQVTHAEVTTPEDAYGYYQCLPCARLGEAEEWEYYEPALVFDANDEPLENGRRYEVVASGSFGGVPLFVANAPPPKDEEYPLTKLPCLVKIEGEIKGFSQPWYSPSTGEARCYTSGFCGCPAEDPPSPETSCCSLWYCTTSDGPIEVEADGDGLYHPPSGWDGNPPHLSQEAAEEACPTPVPPITVGSCCGGTKLLPGRAKFTQTNKTGIWASRPDSVSVTLTDIPGSSGSWDVYVEGVVYRVQFVCAEFYKYVLLLVSSCTQTATVNPDQDMWHTVVAGDFHHDFTCDEDLTETLVGTTFLGTLSTGPSDGCGGAGSVDLYVTWG